MDKILDGSLKKWTVEEEIEGLPPVMSVTEAAGCIRSFPESLMQTLQMEGLIAPGKHAILQTLDIFTALHAHQEKGNAAFQAYLDAHVKI